MLFAGCVRLRVNCSRSWVESNSWNPFYLGWSSMTIPYEIIYGKLTHNTALQNSKSTLFVTVYRLWESSKKPFIYLRWKTAAGLWLDWFLGATVVAKGQYLHVLQTICHGYRKNYQTIKSWKFYYKQINFYFS